MSSIPKKPVAILTGALVLAGALYFVLPKFFSGEYDSTTTKVKADTVLVQNSSDVPVTPPPPPAVLDTAAYDAKMLLLANNPPPPAPKVAKTPVTTGTQGTGTTTAAITPTAPVTPPKPKPTLWPVKTVYPNAGALLPFNRIVAYYGNFYSKGMGVLGQYPEPQMLAKLDVEVKKWEAADPTTPVIPAIDYIAVTAQGSPSVGGKYRLRMPSDQIDHAVKLADQIHGIVFLEIQPGQSTVQAETPMLAAYLKMPQVHLAIDPEFAMKGTAKPGTVIGTLDAADINFCIQYLTKIVQDNNLPPKILIVHRFTRDMVTNYKNIKPTPEVEVIMDMDGWGSPAKKFGTYNNVVAPEPVQFTGFKLFYKNDILPPSTRMLTPTELLTLTPRPIFIQYQ